MIAYVDSSVILRRVLGQAGALREWKDLEAPVARAAHDLLMATHDEALATAARASGFAVLGV